MQKRLPTLLPIRYTPLLLCALGLLWAGVLAAQRLQAGLAPGWPTGMALALCALLVLIGLYDLIQPHHAILRNYPVIGHLRYLLEYIRPEIRQYFIEGDREAEPFSRAQRSLVYQRAKGEPDNRPFGTLLDVSESGYEWINHSLAPTRIASHDFRVWVGGTPQQPSPSVSPCTQPYAMSVFNISAMSFGALSANAILALNQGAKIGGFAHDTGEGSISRYHRVHGGDLVWEIASGYFGCRNADGSFNPERFAEQAHAPQVKMIEIKLSQGAKPGQGGMLLGPKVTPEIAEARGVPAWQDCISPPSHSAFSTPIELLQFVARLRTLSGGKPTGFKLCIGHPWEWFAIAKAMLETGITPDFITVDGAEGGTGAAPVEFSDHVGTPLQEGLQLVHNTLVGLNLRERVRIGCAGKVVSAFDLARMLALGADWCNSARGFMMALGCVQAQSCHTGRCPTGVATQDARRQRALVVPDKAQRVAQLHRSTLHALKALLQAAGLSHPSEITAEHIVRRISATEVRPLARLLTPLQPGALLDTAPGALDALPNLYRRYWPMADAHSFWPMQQR